MDTKITHLSVPWEGPSGTTYDIPVIVTMHYERNYGSDADGRRGVSGWVFDDYELNGITEAELRAVIPHDDDLEEFSLDIISENAFELAFDALDD